VAGGFGGGLFPTGGTRLTALLRKPRTSSIGLLGDILHNYYFKVVSAFVVTAVGWW